MARIVSSDLVKSVTKACQTALMEGFEHASAQYLKIAMVVPTTQKTVTLPWLGEAHKPREWTDRRIPHDLTEYYISGTVKKYEDTMQVERESIEDDQYGQIMPRARSMGEAGGLYIDELIFTELNDGFSTACYDGQNFFSDTHSEKNSGTQDNLTTVAISNAAVTAGHAAMMQFKDDQGRYLGIQPDTLIVTPTDRATALKIINSDWDPDNANQQANPSKGIYNLIVTPYLTAGHWVLAKLKSPIKPLIWIERTKVEFQSDDSMWFTDDVMQYGIRFRGLPKLGNWRLCYGSSYSA